MTVQEFGELYSTIGGLAFFVVLVSGIAYALNRQSATLEKIFKGSGILVVVMMLVDISFDVSPSKKTKQQSSPKVETVAEKPKPPKVEYPEESFYKESYEAIEAKTRMRATETWLLEYGERVTPDGNVDTHGFVEFNDDGIKRQFWLLFDGKTRQVLRVKIDGDLIYSAVGW